MMHAHSVTLLPLFIPDVTPQEMVFSAIIVVAAAGILFGVYAEYIMLGVLWYMVMVFVDLLGPSPFIAILLLMVAGLVGSLVVIGQNLGGAVRKQIAPRLTDADPETLAALVPVVDTIASWVRSRNNRDREDD